MKFERWLLRGGLQIFASNRPDASTAYATRNICCQAIVCCQFGAEIFAPSFIIVVPTITSGVSEKPED